MSYDVPPVQAIVEQVMPGQVEQLGEAERRRLEAERIRRQSELDAQMASRNQSTGR